MCFSSSVVSPLKVGAECLWPFNVGPLHIRKARDMCFRHGVGMNPTPDKGVVFGGVPFLELLFFERDQMETCHFWGSHQNANWTCFTRVPLFDHRIDQKRGSSQKVEPGFPFIGGVLERTEPHIPRLLCEVGLPIFVV